MGKKIFISLLLLGEAGFGSCPDLTSGKLVVQVLKCEPAQAYEGKLLKGKVVRSSADAVGSKVRHAALQGETRNFYLPPGQESLCEFVKGKPVTVKVSQTCCDGTVESPCLTGTSFTLTRD